SSVERTRSVTCLRESLMIRYLTSLLALLGLCSAVVALVRPQWATTFGLDLWNLPQLERELADCERVARRLAIEQVALNQRAAGKPHALRELLDGHLTLTQAAAWFRHLDGEARGVAPDYLPGKTEGERYCREVILWAQAELRDWPADRGAEM